MQINDKARLAIIRQCFAFDSTVSYQEMRERLAYLESEQKSEQNALATLLKEAKDMIEAAMSK